MPPARRNPTRKKAPNLPYWSLVQLALYILAKGRNYGNTPIPLQNIYEKGRQSLSKLHRTDKSSVVEELSTCPETKKQLKGNWWDKYCQIAIRSSVSDGFFIHDEQRKTVRVTHEGRTRFRRARDWVKEQTFNTPAEKIVALGLRLYTHEAGPAKKLNKAQLMHENVRLRHRVRDLEREHEEEEPVMSSLSEASTEDPTFAENVSPEQTTVIETAAAPAFLKTPARRAPLADAAAAYPSPESAPRPRRTGTANSALKREATPAQCTIPGNASAPRGPRSPSSPSLPPPRSASPSPSHRDPHSPGPLATPASSREPAPPELSAHAASPDTTSTGERRCALLAVHCRRVSQTRGVCTWFEQVLADNASEGDEDGDDTSDDEAQRSMRRRDEKGAFEKQQLYKRQQRMQKEIEELREVEEILKGNFGAIARSAQRRGWKPY